MKKDWEYALIGNPLPTRVGACHDCAVECGFYKEISERLLLETLQLQKDVSERWFCHNNPGLACAGNQKFIYENSRNLQ